MLKTRLKTIDYSRSFHSIHYYLTQILNAQEHAGTHANLCMILSEDNGGTYQGMSASHGIIPTTFMVQETQKTENHDPNLA